MRNSKFVLFTALTAMASCKEADMLSPDVFEADGLTVLEAEAQTPTVKGCTVLGEFCNYTGIVEDLMDSNVNAVLTKSGKTVYDKVHGFSISEIERALRGVKSWNGWCENLKRMRNGKNERSEIQNLFDAWGNYCR